MGPFHITTTNQPHAAHRSVWPPRPLLHNPPQDSPVLGLTQWPDSTPWPALRLLSTWFPQPGAPPSTSAGPSSTSLLRVWLNASSSTSHPDPAGGCPSSFHLPGCFASTPVLGPLLSPVVTRGVSCPELQTTSPLGASPRTVLAHRGAHKIASSFDVPHALLLLTTMATTDRSPPTSPAPVLSHPRLPGPA